MNSSIIDHSSTSATDFAVGPTYRGVARDSYGDAGPLPKKSGGNDDILADSGILLEVVFPMTMQFNQREECTKDIGFCVRIGHGGPSGVTRAVLVRLHDPHDPFFLFELELLEDDYSEFKQRLELLVDFNGFPRYLVDMVQGIAQGQSPHHMKFIIHHTDNSRGTVRVIETTPFRTVEHISLLLLRQGDVGQKRYLAEKFKHFEQAFYRCSAERQQESVDHHRTLEEMNSQLSSLLESNRRLKEEIKLFATRTEKENLTVVNRLQESNSKEVQSLHSSYGDKLRQGEDKLEALQKQLSRDRTEKENEVKRLQERNSELESIVASLQSQQRIADNAARSQGLELDQLREMNQELTAFKKETMMAMSENELNYVSIRERLQGAIAAAKAKDEELHSLREHYKQQDEYIRILSTQNTQISDQKSSIEKSLEKANHIIANQLHSLKHAKDRYRIAAEQLQSSKTLTSEREASTERLKGELTTSQERCRVLEQKNTDLRDQLQQTDEARERLVQELKQNQSALVHLQRSTSVNGRHWGFTSGGRALHSIPKAASDLYHEFGRNGSVAPFVSSYSRAPSGAGSLFSSEVGVTASTPSKQESLPAGTATRPLNKTEPKAVKGNSVTLNPHTFEKNASSSMSPPTRAPSFGSCASTGNAAIPAAKMLSTKQFFDKSNDQPIPSAYF